MSSARKPVWMWIIGGFSSLIALNFLYNDAMETQFYRPGLTAFHHGKYADAEHDLRLYLRFENDPDGHYWLGRTFLAEAKWTEARTQFLQDRSLGFGGRRGHERLNARSRTYLRRI